jgi:predicted alpha-1,2-mannosidase
MQIAGMGQYAHGNQPIQHMLYLYGYAGEPWKTQYWVRESMRKLYQATPDGYCGDEDNGQTSAWYVFSALGFYPVCPGTDQYVLGAPLFKKLTLHLDNGKQFVISAPANSLTNLYVEKAMLNGQVWDKNWIAPSTIRQGGEIEFTMGATPNKMRGTAVSAYPYSFSTDKSNPLNVR